MNDGDIIVLILEKLQACVEKKNTLDRNSELCVLLIVNFFWKSKTSHIEIKLGAEQAQDRYQYVEHLVRGVFVIIN